LRKNILPSFVGVGPGVYKLAVKQDQPLLIDGRFISERELGRGGIGVAYLARDTLADNRRIVIKALLERLDDKDSAWVERHFRDEVKARSRINHPP
jgi:eukaryotic-like serine/threonine-protein kinase